MRLHVSQRIRHRLRSCMVARRGRDHLVSDRDGRRRLYRQRIAGGPAFEVLDASRFDDPIPSDVSPDGRILFSDLQRSNWGFGRATRRRSSWDREAVTVPTCRPMESGSIRSKPGGAFEIYVERFPAVRRRRRSRPGAIRAGPPVEERSCTGRRRAASSRRASRLAMQKFA